MDRLMIWHNSQIGSKKDCNFRVSVKNIDEAILILDTIWDYDNFQVEKEMRPDFSSVSGLECFNKEDKCWEEYYNKEGEDIHEIIERRNNNE